MYSLPPPPFSLCHAQEWRRNLWQPRGFRWKGVNYLEKMSNDASFLRSPVGENLLASVGLEARDMVRWCSHAAEGGDVADREKKRQELVHMFSHLNISTFAHGHVVLNPGEEGGRTCHSRLSYPFLEDVAYNSEYDRRRSRKRTRV